MTGSAIEPLSEAGVFDDFLARVRRRLADLLLCEALDLVLSAADRRYMRPFLTKVREVIVAEARQELGLRGRMVDEKTCLATARGKTGALFALAAWACGGEDDTLSSPLEEAGYAIGTAY